MPPARSAPLSLPAVQDARLRSADARIAALVGLIAGAVGHHAIGALVRAPIWVVVATAAIFALAITRSNGSSDRFECSNGSLDPLHLQVRSLRGALSAALIVAFFAAYTLPGSAPPSWQSVITHATAHSVRDDLFEALDMLDARPEMLLGKHISVTGVWRPPDGDNLATVSQRVMACCAADAVDIGFDVLPARMVALPTGTHVRVGGIVNEVLRQGETRYVLREADVKLLNEGSSGVR